MRLLKILVLATLAVGMGTSLQAQEKEGDFANGAAVWSDVCARCHNIRPPEDLSKRAWRYSMNHMRVRAGLTGQETRDILKFIIESKTSSDAK